VERHTAVARRLKGLLTDLGETAIHNDSPREHDHARLPLSEPIHDFDGLTPLNEWLDGDAERLAWTLQVVLALAQAGPTHLSRAREWTSGPHLWHFRYVVTIQALCQQARYHRLLAAVVRFSRRGRGVGGVAGSRVSPKARR